MNFKAETKLFIEELSQLCNQPTFSHEAICDGLLQVYAQNCQILKLEQQESIDFAIERIEDFYKKFPFSRPTKYTYAKNPVKGWYIFTPEKVLLRTVETRDIARQESAELSELNNPTIPLIGVSLTAPSAPIKARSFSDFTEN